MRSASTTASVSLGSRVLLCAGPALVSLGLARALMVAVQDGWWQTGLRELAVRSFSRHAVTGMAEAALPCATLALFFCTERTRAVRAITLLGALALGFLFVSGRLPALAFQHPELTTAAGRLGNAAAALAVLPALCFLGWHPRTSFAARLRAALTVLPLAAVLALRFAPGVCGVAPRDDHGRPSVILISLDTVRADRLGCYGYARDTTPAIDRFAREAFRFERAYSPVPWTLLAHMTMLTGLEPSAHGVDFDRALPWGAPTLAQLLTAQGWLAAAQVDKVNWLGQRYGFGRGFHAYRRLGRNGEFKVDCARELLADLRAEPVFVFLHLYDAHSDLERLPYESTAEDRATFSGSYRGSFTGCDERGLCATPLLADMNATGRTLPAEDRAYLSDLYDAGLRTLDRAVGRLLAALAEEGFLERSIVILTADHGEEFFEHGLALHEQLYEECARVPLLIRLPGGSPGSTSEFAGLADLAPTILELCGLAPPAEMQGRSLAPLLHGEAPARRAHAVLDRGQERIGVRTASWKAAVFRVKGEERLRIFDLATDPREEHILGWEDLPPAEAASLTALLEAERARIAAVRERLGAPAELGQQHPDVREELRQLGYAGAIEEK